MAAQNSQTLEAMWDYISTLSSTSTDSELQHYTSFFTSDAVVYLSGMSQPPSTSHDSLIVSLRTLLTYWAHLDRKITIHVEGDDGSVVNAMENSISITGEALEGFKECEIVKFEGGKISEYLLYCDPAPIMAVFAKKAEGQH
jgi:ketosteroid isomerase-like protein